jgi:hypothetical protein
MNLAARTVHLVSNTKLRSFSLHLQCLRRCHEIETVNEKGIFGGTKLKLELGPEINGIKVLNCNAFRDLLSEWLPQLSPITSNNQLVFDAGGRSRGKAMVAETLASFSVSLPNC